MGARARDWASTGGLRRGDHLPIRLIDAGVRRKIGVRFLLKKKPIRKSVLLLIFASLDFFTDINNTKVCGLREIKNCLEREMSM